MMVAYAATLLAPLAGESKCHSCLAHDEIIDVRWTDCQRMDAMYRHVWDVKLLNIHVRPLPAA